MYIYVMTDDELISKWLKMPFVEISRHGLSPLVEKASSVAQNDVNRGERHPYVFKSLSRNPRSGTKRSLGIGWRTMM